MMAKDYRGEGFPACHADSSGRQAGKSAPQAKARWGNLALESGTALGLPPFHLLQIQNDSAILASLPDL
jgi:hypothetical protein